MLSEEWRKALQQMQKRIKEMNLSGYSTPALSTPHSTPTLSLTPWPIWYLPESTVASGQGQCPRLPLSLLGATSQPSLTSQQC